MKIALVMTVKNEERLLLQNIYYHLGIGVEKIYIYFDETTDNGPDLIQNIEGVEGMKSLDGAKYQEFEYLRKFNEHAKEHHTARQCLNTFDALQKCKLENIDWLISLDADELMITNRLGEEPLQDFFGNYTDTAIELINLRPLEVIARREKYDQVMAEETLFKVKKTYKSKLDQIYQKIYNPYRNQKIITSYWLGQTMGKSAIKVNSGLIPKNVHRYKHIGSKAVDSINAGHVLHYHMYDFDDFIKKFKNFKNHPSVFLSGKKIEDFKQLYIELVNDPNYSLENLKKYYRENLLFDLKKMKQLKKTRFFNIFKRKEKAFIEIKKPRKILKDFL